MLFQYITFWQLVAYICFADSSGVLKDIFTLMKEVVQTLTCIQKSTKEGYSNIFFCLSFSIFFSFLSFSLFLLRVFSSFGGRLYLVFASMLQLLNCLHDKKIGS